MAQQQRRFLAQGALEQRPEVLKARSCVLGRVHTSRVMRHYFVRELILQAVVSDEIIRIDGRVPRLTWLKYFILQCLALYVGNDLRPNLAQLAVKHSQNYSLGTVKKCRA